MKITEAMLCVNRLECNHCEGFGTVYAPDHSDKTVITEKCSVCAGTGDFECGEIVEQSTSHCPSCTGTSFLTYFSKMTETKSYHSFKLHPLEHPTNVPNLKKPF